MTDLVPVAELPASFPAVVPAPPRFGAALATVTFILYLIAQTVAAAGVAFVITIALLIQNGGKNPGTAALMAASMPAATVLGLLAGGGVAAGAALLWARHLRAEAGPRGLGWRRGTAGQQLLAAAGGVAVAVLWILATRYVFPKASPSQYGPLAKTLTAAGWGRYAVAFAGVVIAPPVEELLFRGLLLAGYVRRLGLAAGSIVTTLLFVALHVGETIHYLPALGAVTIVGVLLLLIRIRTDSIFVSTTFHTTYNAALMIVSIAGLPAFR